MMGNPSVSIRKHIRWFPNPVSEPTSTIVLSSRTSYYVDIRILNPTDKDGPDDHVPGYVPSLEWAFAGTSTTSSAPDQSMSHTVWAHWVDSKSINPAADEGDMYPQPDGDVLERGTMTDPHTGQIRDYEELWHDLEINKLGMEDDRVCVVLKADVASPDAKGMVIRIGEWCQGVMKSGDDFTVERWKWLPKARSATEDDVAPSRGNDLQNQDNGEWKRLVRLGNGALPCTVTFQNQSALERGPFQIADVVWEVVENYRW